MMFYSATRKTFTSLLVCLFLTVSSSIGLAKSLEVNTSPLGLIHGASHTVSGEVLDGFEGEPIENEATNSEAVKKMFSAHTKT